jgi:hypothetical protein
VRKVDSFGPHLHTKPDIIVKPILSVFSTHVVRCEEGKKKKSRRIVLYNARGAIVRASGFWTLQSPDRHVMCVMFFTTKYSPYERVRLRFCFRAVKHNGITGSAGILSLTPPPYLKRDHFRKSRRHGRRSSRLLVTGNPCGSSFALSCPRVRVTLLKWF